MRSTAEWETLLDTRNATQWWVEQDEGEDDWAIKAAHPKWNVDALMGSAYSEGAADLMAAAPEAVAEVVRLRREIETLRRDMRHQPSNALASDVGNAITIILEGTHE